MSLLYVEWKNCSLCTNKLAFDVLTVIHYTHMDLTIKRFERMEHVRPVNAWSFTTIYAPALSLTSKYILYLIYVITDQ